MPKPISSSLLSQAIIKNHWRESKIEPSQDSTTNLTNSYHLRRAGAGNWAEHQCVTQLTTMSEPIPIQLPPNLEQHMLQEAQRQNTTVEKLILQSVQNTYADVGDNHIVKKFSLEDFFGAIHDALNSQQTIIQVPVNDIFVEMAENLKSTGILLDFQIIAQKMILYVNPTPPPPPPTLSPDDIDTSKLEPEAARIVEALKNENANIRGQAILALAQWYKRQAG
jgi:ribosomal protein S8